MVEVPYPKAAAKLKAIAPDEALLWMGATGFRHLLPVAAMLGGIGLFLVVFTAAWMSGWEAGISRMPEWVQWVSSFLTGEVYLFILVGAAMMLGAVALLVLGSGTTYAITRRHAWVLTKSGWGMPFSYPLNNVKDMKIHNLAEDGSGDLTLQFLREICYGKMRKTRITFTGVSDVKALEALLLEHLTDQIPE